MKPAGWADFFGLGRIVYLMPGHTIKPFRHPAYREIIHRSGLWAAGNNINPQSIE
jgi:uncharacterized protein